MEESLEMGCLEGKSLVLFQGGLRAHWSVSLGTGLWNYTPLSQIHLVPFTKKC